MPLGLIKGSAVISFHKDSELRILISMAIWAIWKSRNNKTINDQDVALNEASNVLRELIQELMRKCWNTTCFIEGTDVTLWADGRLAVFGPKTGPTVNLA